MNLKTFYYQGKEYQVYKVAELEPESGNRRIQITTTDKAVFSLTYNQSIFKWVVDEARYEFEKA